MLVRIGTKPVLTTIIIQVYMPTSQSNNEEIEEAYEETEELIEYRK